MELDPEISDHIDEHCADGDAFLETERWSDAINSYQKALDLLPHPIEEWDASTWILTAIGDAHFLAGQFAEGRDVLKVCMHCPDAIGNPFIHLRLGQTLFELDDLDGAADELARAYMGGGKEIFEDDDEKFFSFIASRLDGLTD